MNSQEINNAVATFFQWERESHETIDFKKTYVDMADDLVAGLVLSQIIYWHLPDKRGVTRLHVEQEGHYWIAKRRQDWWEEIRVSPKQLDRALEILETIGLIVTSLHVFAGAPTKHIRINWETFLTVRQNILTKGENAIVFSPKGEMHFPQRSKTITENTTETTEESFAQSAKKTKSTAKRRTELTQSTGKAQEPKKKSSAKRKKVDAAPTQRQPQPTDDWFDAMVAGLADVETTTPDLRIAWGWNVGKILHGDQQNYTCEGIIVYECARQRCAKDQLNYQELAQSTVLFWQGLRKYHADLDFSKCETICRYWSKFRVAQDKKTAKQQPKAKNNCPHCGGKGVVEWVEQDGVADRLFIQGELLPPNAKRYFAPCICKTESSHDR